MPPRPTTQDGQGSPHGPARTPRVPQPPPRAALPPGPCQREGGTAALGATHRRPSGWHCPRWCRSGRAPTYPARRARSCPCAGTAFRTARSTGRWWPRSRSSRSPRSGCPGRRWCRTAREHSACDRPPPAPSACWHCTGAGTRPVFTRVLPGDRALAESASKLCLDVRGPGVETTCTWRGPPW